MSPEICAAERYSLYSDIWSLGCVMYELCTKEPPFNAKTHFDLIQKIKVGKFAPLPRNYSRELSDVIAACLQVDSRNRPDTASLLNLPRVKLIRKTQQSAILVQEHQMAKEHALKELEMARELISRLEGEKAVAFEEMNKRLHMEWETRAQLEINRRVDLAEKQFAELLDQKVEEAVKQRIGHISTSQTSSSTSLASSLSSKPATVRSSKPSSISEDGASPYTTDNSCLSMDETRAERKVRLMRQTPRTPFTRARTIANAREIIPSPMMDIEMMSPSPTRGIARLSLSPRRPTTKTPTSTKNNVFALASAITEAQPPNDENVLPGSPTRKLVSSRPQGRTLVELDLQRRALAPVWNPATDEMPSPFLIRGRRRI